MTRVALVSSEPVRATMAGIGIRYLELARRLPSDGIEVVLVSPAGVDEVPEVPGEVRSTKSAAVGELVADADVVVAQGQLANDVALSVRPEVPVVVDLYDPWLVENLHYAEELGLDPYRNDHASWVLQMSRGDLFLCSSLEQRRFYLGFLAALGRVNPERVSEDPALDDLVRVLPFGIPDELPPHRPVLEATGSERDGERRILFGGLYDWYDPWTLLEALERLDAREGGPRWRLLFVANPNPDSTPQRLLADVERECRRRGWWERRVEVLPWMPAARRFDLLRDVDVLVSPHRRTLETELSLRTRFLEGMAVGCPVVLSEGGPLGRLVREAEAGWVVPCGDVTGLAASLSEILGAGEEVERRRRRGHELAAEFRWDRVIEPLVQFCRAPRRDTTKEAFAFRPPTMAPAERLSWRLRRWWRRLRRRLS